MLARKLEPDRMTEAEYLAFEAASDFRYEYMDGYVLAMAGGSRSHERIVRNLIAGLEPQLQPRGCESFGSNLKVRTPSKMRSYPDVSIVCGKPEFTYDNGDALVNPVVIIEVLSPSTEDIDRGRKFLHYRTIPSLREYVLIAQDKQEIEYRRRTPDGRWFIDYSEPGETVLDLQSLGIQLPLEMVYRAVFET
jgi:Uma2 family endonuclease